MLFMLTTDGGIEDLVADELLEFLPGATADNRYYEREGRLRVAAARSAGLESLRTIHDIVEVRCEAEADSIAGVERALETAEFPELCAAASFRVTSERVGQHSFGHIDLERAAGAVLQRRYGTRVDLEHHEINVRVDLYRRRLVAGIQLTSKPLSKRIQRARALRTALKPTLAAAMVRLAGADRGPGRLIDPCCGTGTIPIEAKQMNVALEASGCDWDAATVETARLTVQNHGLDIEIRDCDARALAASYAGFFDWIVSDPPYGVRVGRRADMVPLYEALLESFERVLAPHGRIVLLVLKFRSFLRALAPQPLDIVHERLVQAGALRPRVFVLARRGEHRATGE